jgi:4-amino-4-deoxy-L-arabinose transferase-like glycosyltransferase
LLWIWRGWLDGEATLADDAFYYFQIARQVARGLGPTFDGLAPTNGFHPLYLLLLSGLHQVWAASPWIPIHAALSLLVLCDVMSTWLVYRIAAGWSARAGLAATLLWITCPLAVATSHRGMESSLSTLLVLAGTRAFLRWRDRPRESGRGVLLGLILGLAILARTENLLFLITVGVCALGAHRRSAPHLWGVGLLPVAGLLGPWILWQLRTFGSVEQSSGTAIRVLRIYGHLDSPAHTSSPAMLLGQVRDVFEWLHRAALAQEFEPLRGLGSAYVVASAALALGVVILGTTAGLARTALRRRLASILPLIVYAVLHVAYYFGFAHTYRPWYHLTLVVAFILVGVAVAEHLLARARLWLACLAWVVVQAAVLGTYGARAARCETSRTAEQRIAWLERNCGPSARVGLMNAGKLAYLAGFRSRLTIVNLDGVVNNVLLEAYRTGSFAVYFCDTLDFALELPGPHSFRDPRLRMSWEHFQAACIEELPTRPVPLFRIRCDSACRGTSAPRPP